MGRITIVTFIAFLFCCFRIFISGTNYHIWKNGKTINAQVYDNRGLCERYHKYLLAKTEEGIYRVNIQGSGPDCMEAKFPKNSIIKLKKLDGRELALYEGNNYLQPLIALSLVAVFTLSITIFFFWMYRKGRQRSPEIYKDAREKFKPRF